MSIYMNPATYRAAYRRGYAIGQRLQAPFARAAKDLIRTGEKLRQEGVKRSRDALAMAASASDFVPETPEQVETEVDRITEWMDRGMSI